MPIMFSSSIPGGIRQPSCRRKSRAHRIGQEKQVFVYRFITADTIEEKIRNLQESKSELAETFISENDPLKSLTDKEWEDLL